MALKIPKIVTNPINKEADFMDHVAAFKFFLDKEDFIPGKSFIDLLESAIAKISASNIDTLYKLASRGTEQELACSIILKSIVNHCLQSQSIEFYYKILLLGMRFWDDQEFDHYLDLLKEQLLKVDISKDCENTYKEVLLKFIHAKSSRSADVVLQSPLRIAICVSGQMRGYEAAFQSWNNLDLQNAEVDYFVHTWTEVGRRIADRPQHAARLFQGEFLEAYNSILELKGYAYIRKNYPTLCEYTLKTSSVKVDDLKRLYNTEHVVIEDDSVGGFLSFSNQQKMLYKIYACNELVKKSGKIYDLVVRIRPDKLFGELNDINVNWRVIAEYSRHYKALFTAGHTVWLQHLGIAMNDQFAVASPEVFDAYAQSFTTMSQEDSDKVIGFRVLAGQLVQHGIRIRRMPIIRHVSLSDIPRMTPDEIYSLLLKDIQGRSLDTDAILLDALNGTKA